MNDTLWIGTSWKMNKTLAQALAFSERLSQSRVHPTITPFVIPPFTCARQVKSALADTPLKVGAQNMHWAEAGAWTGEIAPAMLTDCQLDLVELGHSERRTHFGETNETVGRKTEAAVRHGLVPLICIGETEADKSAGRADAVLEEQVTAALAPLSEAQRSAPILFAYEPVWAIGENGTPATPAYASERHAGIIEVTERLAGRKLPCLYGGSVNTDNAVELVRQPGIDGLFIGRAAWTAEGFLDILERCAAVT